MDSPTPIRVWDLPTRLFHWTLALSVTGSVISAKVGGNALTWHLWLGQLAFGLITFRILWGFFGGRWSRFSSFVHAPSTVWRYLRGTAAPGTHLDVGHSPLGALSVFALLAVLAMQVATGLVADDEIATVGPLNRLVSSATALSATGWHKGWGQWLLLALVGMHLAAVAFYTWRGKPLLRAMVSGDKPLPAATPASADTTARRALALVLAAVSAGLVTWVVRLGG